MRILIFAFLLITFFSCNASFKKNENDTTTLSENDKSTASEKDNKPNKQLLYNTWLWKIESKKSGHVSYLFGTEHDFGSSIFNSYTNVVSAFSRSKVVIIENLLSQMKGDSLNLSIENLKHGLSLWQKVLSPEENEVMKEYIEENLRYEFVLYTVTAIVPIVDYEYASKYCPNSRKASDTSLLMDSYIEVLAEKKKKKVIALDFEIHYNAGNELISDTNYLSMDKQLINEMITTMRESNNKVMNGTGCDESYQNLDSGINYQFDTTPAYQPFSADYRNKKWLPIIENLINQNNCFIAVGTGHLMYKNGIIKLLQDEGYKVTPVQEN
jgi:uncharacterized protein YbaP (TraB family)